ncbi:winged helix-turn-helix domain-containing protein [Lacrimispora xylanisolvens]|uniref:winged helix-turn-helix domain-containing protein n=1 Tax=Lacrimispora xylanisolvens TaxID=384636 RepID=UPI003D9CB371
MLDQVWGENYVGDLKVVDVNIRRIRRKIEDDPANPTYLCTEWGYGYIWKE